MRKQKRIKEKSLIVCLSLTFTFLSKYLFGFGAIFEAWYCCSWRVLSFICVWPREMHFQSIYNDVDGTKSICHQLLCVQIWKHATWHGQWCYLKYNWIKDGTSLSNISNNNRPFHIMYHLIKYNFEWISFILRSFFVLRLVGKIILDCIICNVWTIICIKLITFWQWYFL